MTEIVFRNLKDINLEHVFECGQCFRWVPADDGSGDYIGAAGKYAARISLRPSADSSDVNGNAAGTMDLYIEATGGDEAFWHSYFDLDTDYSLIKEELVRSEPEIEKAASYGYGIRILRQEPFKCLCLSFAQGSALSVQHLHDLISRLLPLICLNAKRRDIHLALFRS